MIENLSVLLPGLAVSLRLLGLALLAGLPLGLLAGIALFRSPRWLRWPVAVLTEVGRGFPALVTVYLVYFGFPQVGVVLNDVAALTVAFGFTTASYTADLFRSALASVPKAQHEAIAALALPPLKGFALVLLPQALRHALPALIGFAVIVFQGTALAFSIGLKEVIGIAYDEGTLRFDVLPLLITAAALYLAVSLILTALASGLQRRLDPTARPATRRRALPRPAPVTTLKESA
ncbi:MAG: ABC transporter permease subunit [Arthrobacter sp.]|jgi:polar amino acid transport system permease protein|nr:ABC transporter permease subunit [Arthrobacter sp.]